MLTRCCWCRFLIRRERGGPVVFRVEPTYRDDWLVIPPEAYTPLHAHYSGDEWPMYAYDSLYNHFQIEKYAGEFASQRILASSPFSIPHFHSRLSVLTD